MKAFDREIITGKMCPYCYRPTELIDSAEVYHGTSYGMMYICRPCHAYVGCHHGGTKALGRLANEELRRYKHCSHELFDLIWKNHFMERYNAYSWLSGMIGTPREFTHIGMFDVDLCRKVIICSSNYLMNKNPNVFSQIISDKKKQFDIIL